MRTGETKKLRQMILAALLMAMTVVLTLATRIPVPATQGYIHLGDCMLLVAAVILGARYGAAAAAFGAALADIIGGYAYFAPVSFLVKGAVVLLLVWFFTRAAGRTETAGKKESAGSAANGNKVPGSAVIRAAGLILAGAALTGGYYLAESVLYGSFVVPLAEVPMNLLQYGAGVAVAWPLCGALGKTALGRDFACRIS